MSTYRILGGVFLLAGTAIGVGMLSLPVFTGAAGFKLSLLVFITVYFFMLYNLFLLLEVLMGLPDGAHMINAVETNLGKTAKYISVTLLIVYLYAVLSAYILGIGGIIQESAEDYFHSQIPLWSGSLIYIIMISPIIYKGVGLVDYVNRVLLLSVVLAFIFLIFTVSPHIRLELLDGGIREHLLGCLPVVVIAFTVGHILPSLKQYLNSDIHSLKITLFIGTLIPLTIYIIWQLVILGVVPDERLSALAIDDAPLVALTDILIDEMGLITLGTILLFFTAFSLLMPSLGAALSMTHLFADTFKLTQRKIIILLIYLVPFAVAIFYPRGFLAVLEYAGMMAVLLFAMLPTIMVWKIRYIDKKISKLTVFGGKRGLVLNFVVAWVILVIEIADRFLVI